MTPFDAQYGALLPNGTWSGKVGMLQRKEIDMGIVETHFLK